MSEVGRESEQVYLIVHTDRSALRRYYGTLLGVHGAFALVFLVLILWLVAALGAYLTWPILMMPVVALAGQFLQVATVSYVWGARAAAARPLTVSSAGVQIDTPAGPVGLTWSAVESVTYRRAWYRPVLIVRPWPAAGPGTPGVDIGVPSRTWHQYRRYGIALDTRRLRPGVEDPYAWPPAGASASTTERSTMGGRPSPTLRRMRSHPDSRPPARFRRTRTRGAADRRRSPRGGRAGGRCSQSGG